MVWRTSLELVTLIQVREDDIQTLSGHSRNNSKWSLKQSEVLSK